MSRPSEPWEASRWLERHYLRLLAAGALLAVVFAILILAGA